MKKSIAIALLLLLSDVLIFNYLVVLLILLAALIKCIIAGIRYVNVLITKKGEAITKQQLSNGVIYVIAIIMIFALNGINNRIANSRATALIAACEHYKQNYGQYPKEITDLVPEYIDEIPSPKYYGIQNEFHYAAREGRHILFYIVIPPFGSRIYNFETHEWKYIG